MTATAHVYGPALQSMLNKELDYDTDSMKAMLCTSGYTPNGNTDRYKSSVTNEVTGTGYTATGVTLASKTVVYTAANSWATAWAASTARAVGDVVRPTTGNGFLYRCSAAGTSDPSTEPTWPTGIGQTVVDGTATWVCAGTGILVLDCADISWASATITARYLVIYDATPATDATRPLLCWVDFTTDQSSTSPNAFTYQVPVAGLLQLFTS